MHHLQLSGELSWVNTASPSLSDAEEILGQLWASELYAFSNSETCRSPDAPIKEEVPDSFIMDPSIPPSQVPIPKGPLLEVPWRDTNASQEMRKMMRAFYLNPFTKHGSARRSNLTWSGQVAGPLEGMSRMFVFPVVNNDVESSSKYELGNSMESGYSLQDVLGCDTGRHADFADEQGQYIAPRDYNWPVDNNLLRKCYILICHKFTYDFRIPAYQSNERSSAIAHGAPGYHSKKAWNDDQCVA
jgi:hypothetical protein